MRLASLSIKNYKCISDNLCHIKIDEIVVLIGQNNAGKSTILDAYEVFASGGKELDESHFNNKNKTSQIEITGTFNHITEEDENTIGKKWKHSVPDYGECIKVRWVWSKPNTKGKKLGFDPTPEVNDFIEGGLGGWDSLIQSRIPQPVRIKPTDSVETTQTKIVGMLKEHVKTQLKSDSSSTQQALFEIERLTEKIFLDAKKTIDEIASKITSNITQVFPGATIELIPKSKDPLDEKVIGADSFLKIGTADGATPLMLQGTGIQRALLWSALSVMSDSSKKKSKQPTNEPTKILLVDEPEAFLHPPIIRNARESLYDFALNNTDWQVIATTHSPIFIDLAKDHTTIIRVDPNSPNSHYISTDQIAFSPTQKDQLKMARQCNPFVNEFFFYDRVILVEGPTEHITINHVAEKMGVPIHVIDCHGKGNIPTFCKILNKFKVKYLAIHDSDTPKIKKKGVLSNGGMWTINSEIRNEVLKGGTGTIFTQFPHFEGEFLGSTLSTGKVDNIIKILSDHSSTEYQAIFHTYSALLSGEESLLTTTEESFNQKKSKYLTDNNLTTDVYWV